MQSYRAVRALVVDDTGIILQVVADMLAQMGFAQIDTAKNGLEAWERLQENSYGLAIVDWNMSPVSGFELLKRVRAASGLRNLPVLIMTTQAETSRVTAAAEAGANGMLVKPFSIDTFKAKVKLALG